MIMEARSLVSILILFLLVTSVSASVNTIVQSMPAGISSQHNNGACWFFPTNHSLVQNPLYDIRSHLVGNHSHCDLTGIQTAGMEPGNYLVLYVYPVKTEDSFIKDISLEDSKLVSIFAKTKPIDIAGKQSDMVLADLRTMLIGSTDKYEEYNVIVEEPYFVVKIMEQVYPTIVRISGETNLEDGTPVTIKVDEMERYALHDLQNFTFATSVFQPDITIPGTWTRDMNMPLQDMAPGWHEVVVTAGKITVTTKFPIYQTWEASPTPTHYINYFGNGTMKPETIVVEKVVRVVETKEVIVQLTAAPTPDITDALGEKIDGIKLESQLAMFVIAGVGLAFFVLVIRGWKR